MPASCCSLGVKLMPLSSLTPPIFLFWSPRRLSSSPRTTHQGLCGIQRGGSFVITCFSRFNCVYYRIGECDWGKELPLLCSSWFKFTRKMQLPWLSWIFLSAVSPVSPRRHLATSADSFDEDISKLRRFSNPWRKGYLWCSVVDMRRGSRAFLLRSFSEDIVCSKRLLWNATQFRRSCLLEVLLLLG